MLDRESTFADPKIISLLTNKFIPVAIDQWYTRRQQDTEGEFYRGIAGQGPRNDFTKTTQGLYIADAGGGLIAFNNNRGPERIRALLESATTDYKPPKITAMKEDSTDPKYNPKLPEGAIVVRTSAKVLSGYEKTDDHWENIFHQAVSRDNLWITAEEQRELLDDRIPEALKQRIARFHLVDNTRGEPPTWELDEIRKLEITIIQGRIAGAVELATKDQTRGYQATLSGMVSGSGGKITEFTLLTEGQFWGTGDHTMKPPAGKFPLTIAFQLADGTDIADPIAPHASRGWLDGYWYPDR